MPYSTARQSASRKADAFAIRAQIPLAKSRCKGRDIGWHVTNKRKIFRIMKLGFRTCLLVGWVGCAQLAAPAGEPSVARPRGTTEASADPAKAAEMLLAARVRQVLDDYYHRPLNTRDDAPWSVLHWSLAYGVDAQIALGGPRGKRATAIGWLCCNRPTAGKVLFSPSRGELQLPIAPGLQGHHGQFLAMLAQSRLKRDYLLQVDGRSMTVDDLVEHEQRTCRKGMELTFKLIGLAHYLDSESTWPNAHGELWSVRSILEEELAQPINRWEACCGGTHRLFALSFAVHRRRKEGNAIDGPWQQALQRNLAYQQRAFRLQHRDGSFSTAWLERPESRGDLTRRMLTTGHVLEWLAFALEERELSQRPFQRALLYVVGTLENNRKVDWHAGALGHSLHALSIYEQRILGARPGDRRQRLGEP